MNFLLTIIVGGLFLIVIFTLFNLFLEKIFEKLALMPSSRELTRIFILLGVIIYLSKDYLLYYFLLGDKASFSAMLGIIIPLLFLVVIRLIDFFKFYSLEKEIDNNYALPLIIELCNRNYCCSYCIAELLNLPKRNDYSILIPMIIDNLKKRNKLPYDLYVGTGGVPDEDRNDFIKILKEIKSK